MPLTIKTEKQIRHIAFAGDLTIYQAAEYRQQLVENPSRAKRYQLDLSEVTEIDGAGVQLLLSLDKSIRSAGASLSLGGASDSAESALALFNLSRRWPAVAENN